MGLLVAIAFSPAPTVLSRWLSGAGPPDRADAIVVLGGGGVRPDGTLSDNSLRRTLHGITLYRRQLAPLIVFSGSRQEAEVRRRLAHECAVRPDDILTEPSSRTTREEALNISALLHPRGVRKILLVTDGQGIKRATAVFGKAGFEVLPAASSDISELPETPEASFGLLRRVLIELLAWLYYWIAGYL